MKMKKILAVLLILLLILILVLVVRTVTYKFGKVPKNADDKELVNSSFGAISTSFCRRNTNPDNQ